MAGVTLEHRFREIFEYDLKPAWNLLRQGELGFLFGAVVEELTGRNPYFRYREHRGKDQIVTRRIRGHEMSIDLYDRGISRHLFIRGVHEANATAAYREALAAIRSQTSGDITVLDIGGNIGYYVLEVADVLGDQAKIITFEPDSKNRNLLVTNIEFNGYDDIVEISPKAVDETSGKQTFCRSTHSNWNRLERDTPTGNSDEFVERFTVETTSVDEFLTETGRNPESVNAVRMDLEGHELNVLRGMKDVLSATGSLVLFVEFHPNFGDSREYEAAMSTLEEYGFSIRYVGQDRKVLDIDSFEELRSVEGSHVRVIAKK